MTRAICYEWLAAAICKVFPVSGLQFAICFAQDVHQRALSV